MLKMFLAAVGASSASMAVISVVAPAKFAKARAKARGRRFGGRERVALSFAARPRAATRRYPAARSASASRGWAQARQLPPRAEKPPSAAR